jgi:inactivated superfamily I helicase
LVNGFFASDEIFFAHFFAVVFVRKAAADAAKQWRGFLERLAGLEGVGPAPRDDRRRIIFGRK